MAKLPVKGSNQAQGVWSRNIYTHINLAGQVPQKVLAWHYSQLQGMGLRYSLWTRLTSNSEARSIQCSCFRETTQASDTPCLSCYGMRYQPGFIRFGYRTTFYSSIHSDLTLTNLTKDTNNTPNRLLLTSGQLTGNLVTPNYTIIDTNTGTWSYKLDCYARDSTNTILGEFSLDNGSTWHNLTLLGTTGFNPTLAGTIKFRVTLTRPDLNTKSPIFEILRARFQILTPIRKDMNSGEILILKTWDMMKFMRESTGKRTESQGEKYWTTGLSHFDPNIVPDTASDLLNADHFLEESVGPTSRVRFVGTQHEYSRTFGRLTQQTFTMRQLVGDPNNINNSEPLYRVW